MKPQARIAPAQQEMPPFTDSSAFLPPTPANIQSPNAGHHVKDMASTDPGIASAEPPLFRGDADFAAAAAGTVPHNERSLASTLDQIVRQVSVGSSGVVTHLSSSMPR